MMTMSDEINAELDRRKIQAEIDAGTISDEELANAPVISKSECCGADLLGEELLGGNMLRLTCSKCHKPCEGAEE